MIQLDCPEDANTYIHRAGRTARWVVDLVLSRSETGSRRGLWSLIPTLFSQESCIKDVCFRWIDLYPKISFSFPTPARILASPTSRVAVKSCILRSLTLYLVKSRTPRIPPQTNADLINKGVELNHMEGNMAKDSYSDVFSIFWSLHSTMPLQPFIL